MRILILNPPQIFKYGEEPRIGFPLSIGYLSSILKKHGFSHAILDCIAEGYNKRTKSKDKYILGLTIKDIKKKILNLKPDIIMISCPYSTSYNLTKEIVSKIKSINKNIITILGGAHPSSEPKSVLQNESVDFIIAGEGEKTIIELLNNLIKKKFENIPGLGYKKNGRIIINEKKPILNLNKLPFPNRPKFLVDAYIKANKHHTFFRKKKRIANLIISRGCVYKCPFCSSYCIFGSKWRTRFSKNVIAEIDSLINNNQIQEFHIEDDDLLHDNQHINDFLDKLIAKNNKICWTAPNGLRPGKLNKNLLLKMRKSGCYALFLAIESGDKEILSSMNKPQDLEQIKKITQLSRKLGFYIVGFFLLGMPKETRESIIKTINFSKSLDLDEALFTIVIPYPGSEIYKLNKKYIKRLEDLNPKEARLNTLYLSKKNIERLRNKAYINFELNKFLKHPLNYFSLNQVRRLARYMKYVIKQFC